MNTVEELKIRINAGYRLIGLETRDDIAAEAAIDEVAGMLGSQSNDAAYVDPQSGRVRFKTNHAGGILGGITTWEDIRFRCAIKPTPTVSVPQDTVNVAKMENTVLSPITRRDPTLLPRIYPVIEAMTRCVILDAIYMAQGYWKVSGIDEKWLKI